VPNANPRPAQSISLPDLTIPEIGSTTARTVFSGALARLLRELPAIGRGFPISSNMHADLLQFQTVCRNLAKTPGALPSLLRRTPLATLIRVLRHQPSEALVREFIGLMYFELAQLGALEAPLRQLCPPRQLVSLGGRLVFTFSEAPSSITYTNSSLIVDNLELKLANYEQVHPGFSSTMGIVVTERPYHSIENDIVLALRDNNPLSMFEAHPDKQGNAIDLGGKSSEEWTQVLRDGLQLIEEMLPDLRREMDLFVQQIVPVGFDEQKHLSASYQEAIGTIYMSLHPSLMTMTEALIHEFSHNKINALFELDDVLENAFSPLYTSPVRPDPRPLHGVLLAVHAFLPVARLYEKMIETQHPLAQNAAFLGRYERIKQINAEGAEVVLKNGRPTAMGKPLLEEIRKWDGYYKTA
jgi:hypothetical protein